MQAIIIIICAVVGTTGFNKSRSLRTEPPPYWRQNHFEERDLPDSLKGKSMHYIDSVFKAK